MIFFLTSAPPLNEDFSFSDENSFISEIRAAVKDTVRGLLICSDPDDREKTERHLGAIKTSFELSKIKFSRFDVLDGRNSEKAAELVSSAGFILLDGGHVPTQNKFFMKIGLKELLKDFDGVLMGISAGTMNSAGTVYAQPELEGEAVDPDYVRFFPGLGLTRAMVLPHYQANKDDVLDGLKVYEDIAFPDSMGREFYALVDGSYIFIKDGKQELRGEAYLIKDAKMTKISSVGDITELE